MVACRETNYNLEWNGHEATALKSGVDAKVIDIVRRGAPLTGISEEDATVIRFGRQLYTDRKIDSATFAKAVQLFTQRGVMDMVAIMNTYAVSGFYGIAVDEQAAVGKTPLEQIKR
jgi:4-carboxymuconolactone decarboxylase